MNSNLLTILFAALIVAPQLLRAEDSKLLKADRNRMADAFDKTYASVRECPGVPSGKAISYSRIDEKADARTVTVDKEKRILRIEYMEPIENCWMMNRYRLTLNFQEGQASRVGEATLISMPEWKEVFKLEGDCIKDPREERCFHVVFSMQSLDPRTKEGVWLSIKLRTDESWNALVCADELVKKFEEVMNELFFERNPPPKRGRPLISY